MHKDVVEDPDNLLSRPDHMRDMERLEMTVLGVASPTPSVARVSGRIAPRDPQAWTLPNQTVRIEVESPAGLRPISRVYTIRSFDARTRSVEIDFVRHDDDSPAMRWLANVKTGDRVWMTGPRQHFIPGNAPGKAALVFADETAIPAVHAILMQWPEGLPGEIWVETGDAAAFHELPQLAGVAMHLLHRPPERPAGSTGALFATARSRLADVSACSLWAAGERQEMRDFRNHFKALGMARQDLRVFGYWKRGTSSSEIDRARLQGYSRLLRQGGTLEDVNDFDLPI